MVAVIYILYVICNKCEQYYTILYVIYDNISLQLYTKALFFMRHYIIETFSQFVVASIHV